MTEVGKGDDGLFANADHLLENGVGSVQHLKRVSQHDDVKTLVWKIIQPPIHVLLNHGDAPPSGSGDIVDIELNPQRIDITRSL
jgi:hypothetical protein